MSVPFSDLEVEDDKFNVLDDSESDVEPTTRREEEVKPREVPSHHGFDRLQVPYDPFRPKSPDTLPRISVEQLASGRDASQIPWSRQGHAPRTVKEKLSAFWQKNKGLALVMISQVFGCLMNVTTRILEIEGNHGKGLHPFQILFVRMGITSLLSCLYMWYKQIEDYPLGKKEVRWLLVARGLGGFFGVFGMYYSLLYLPLADATVITFLAPSMACWACSFFINEPFTRMEQIAAAISLGGVVLIARPTSLFSSDSPNPPAPPASGTGDVAPALNGTTHETASLGDYHSVTASQRASAVGIAMLGVIGSAVAYTTIRWIGRRAHALISVNYFAMWCFLVSCVMLAALPNVGFILPATRKEWGLLLFLGVCGFVMQFLMAAGLQHEKSSRATNMVYTQMLFALSFDKLFFGVTPGVLSIVGSSLILGSAIYVAVYKGKAEEVDALRETDEERGLVQGMEGAEGGMELVRQVSAEPARVERMPLQEVQARAMRV